MASRLVYFALAAGIAMLISVPQALRAGGPRTIAGTSYFDPAVTGAPLTWSQGVVSYYTDRGNLSPTYHSAGHRFGDSCPPGTGRERNFSSGGVPAGGHAAAGLDRRNCGHQKSRTGHCVIFTAGSAVRWIGAGDSSASNRRSPWRARGSGYGCGRNQYSSLSATVASAGHALGIL